MEILDLMFFSVRAVRMGKDRIAILSQEIPEKNGDSWYVVIVEFFEKNWLVKTKFKIEGMDGTRPTALNETIFG